jgi:hypothetical protein
LRFGAFVFFLAAELGSVFGLTALVLRAFALAAGLDGLRLAAALLFCAVGGLLRFALTLLRAGAAAVLAAALFFVFFAMIPALNFRAAGFAPAAF